MSKTIWKFVIAVSLCLITFNTYALWKCQSSNFRGSTWDAVFSSRSQAATMSLSACRTNSGWKARKTCGINYCRQVSSRQLRGTWQCNASNMHGRTWFAIAATKHYARKIALTYCKANSRSPRSCHINACFIRR